MDAASHEEHDDASVEDLPQATEAPPDEERGRLSWPEAQHLTGTPVPISENINLRSFVEAVATAGRDEVLGGKQKLDAKRQAARHGDMLQQF